MLRNKMRDITAEIIEYNDKTYFALSKSKREQRINSYRWFEKFLMGHKSEAVKTWSRNRSDSVLVDVFHQFIQYLVSNKLSNATIKTYLGEMKRFVANIEGVNVNHDIRQGIHEAMKIELKTSRNDVEPVTLGSLDIDLLQVSEWCKFSVSEQNLLRYWLFSCYTGLRAEDVFALNQKNSAIKEVGDSRVLCFYSGKSKRYMEVPVNSYCDTLHNEMPLPTYSYRSASQYIKQVFRKLAKVETFKEMATQLVKVRKVTGNVQEVFLEKFCDVVTFHTARHSYTRRLLEKDVDIYTASKLLGHSSIMVTAKYYASLGMDERNEKVSEKLGF